ncbi:FAD-dependent oxidoreductase [Aliiroseovarius sediminis]|uniref:NAD(P)/FAD-dependent oxidoreductase n=1 Tax=Aliiroseovarius sediminis TaxID=2925839 RepID=UPI001F58133E|nr:FAD-dependent oxidoreductase [Aliiroseovarius sediminis]MCI2393829.1 FAD-dependent oxidoreductase [Aliiroseovarius sediminis]
MRIGIIGAGVIGITAAHALMRDGHQVTVFDPAGIAEGASKGNAGAFAFSDIIPLATPGILKQAPKWLFDPLGPLSIRPGYALQLLPWLIRFTRASAPDRYVAARDAQAAMMRLSAEALTRQLDTTNTHDLIRREGQLQLYDTPRQLRASKPGWDERAAAGIRFETLTTREAIRDIQPGLSDRFTSAVFTPDWINTTDPQLWVKTLAEDLVRNGGQIEQSAVHALHPDGSGTEVHHDNGTVRFDKVVLAAGAHSNTLLRPLGLSLPLETERGYNTTLPAGAFDVRTHLTFSSHGFVVTRIGDGVRVGGAVELGGLHLPPNMKRAQILLDKAKSFLPDLDTSDGVQWMGFRPSMPDSLPAIGPAPGHPNLVLAFGHGHLGLTQAAGTAELLVDLIAGRPTALDLAPFDPSRFTKARP